MKNNFTYKKNEIGKRLKKFILINYDSIQNYSQKFQIAQSTLSLYFNGNREPGAEILSKFYNTGCNLHWLMDGEGDMYANNDTGMYLAEQHGYERKKSKEDEMYDMVKELRDKMIEGIISPRVAANSNVAEKPEEYITKKDEEGNDKDDRKTMEPK